MPIQIERMIVQVLMSCFLPGIIMTPGFSKETDPGKSWNREWNNDDRWNQMDTGPFMASVLRTPGGVIAKGLSIKLKNKRHPVSIAYDTQTCTMRAAWTGGF